MPSETMWQDGWLAAARTCFAQELRDSPWAMPLEGAGKCKNKMHTKHKKTSLRIPKLSQGRVLMF